MCTYLEARLYLEQQATLDSMPPVFCHDGLLGTNRGIAMAGALTHVSRGDGATCTHCTPEHVYTTDMRLSIVAAGTEY